MKRAFDQSSRGPMGGRDFWGSCNVTLLVIPECPVQEVITVGCYRRGDWLELSASCSHLIKVKGAKKPKKEADPGLCKVQFIRDLWAEVCLGRQQEDRS